MIVINIMRILAVIQLMCSSVHVYSQIDPSRIPIEEISLNQNSINKAISERNSAELILAFPALSSFIEAFTFDNEFQINKSKLILSKFGLKHTCISDLIYSDSKVYLGNFKPDSSIVINLVKTGTNLKNLTRWYSDLHCISIFDFEQIAITDFDNASMILSDFQLPAYQEKNKIFVIIKSENKSIYVFDLTLIRDEGGACYEVANYTQLQYKW